MTVAVVLVGGAMGGTCEVVAMTTVAEGLLAWFIRGRAEFIVPTF